MDVKEAAVHGGRTGGGVRRTLRADDGAASVLAAFMVAAIVAVTVMVVDIGAAVAARHRAQSAADLAALAGAANAIDPDAACRAVAELARANAATVTVCSVEEFEVVVRVEVVAQLSVLGRRTASTSARAGPA